MTPVLPNSSVTQDIYMRYTTSNNLHKSDTTPDGVYDQGLDAMVIRGRKGNPLTYIHEPISVTVHRNFCDHNI